MIRPELVEALEWANRNGWLQEHVGFVASDRYFKTLTEDEIDQVVAAATERLEREFEGLKTAA